MGKYVKRTTKIQVGLLGILTGLLLAKLGYAPSLRLLLLPLIMLPFMVRSRFPSMVVFLIAGLGIGLWRGFMLHDDLQKYNRLYDNNIELIGTVTSDAVYENRGQLEFSMTSLMEVSTGQHLPGTVQVRGYAMSVERYDRLRVTGKLRSQFGNKQGYLSFAEIEVIGRDSSWLESVRSKFIAGTYSTLPEPHASLGLGFLIGTRSLLPETLSLALSVTGLTHIVAVSGYNLTILVRMMRRLFARQSIYLSVASSISLIVAFVLVSGVSPSIARAAVVSIIALTALYYGRTLRPTMLLLVAAAITGMINPLYPWFDIGWYLSFAAFWGVLILAPAIQSRFFSKKPKILGQIILETSSAQIMTFPIISLIFGEVSVISLLANLLVLPFIPITMLATFIAGIGGMLLPSIAGWLAWPANLLLRYLLEVISFSAQTPGALRPFSINPWQMGSIYAALMLLTITLWLKRKRNFSAVEVVE